MSLKTAETDIRELAENFCAVGKGKIPKTGLTKRMRAWMSARVGKKYERRFSIEQICAALDIPAGRGRQKAASALGDFQQRGEVKSYLHKKCNRRQYIYVHDWKPAKKGTLNQKIFKAMYVSQSFAVTDIQRLAGEEDRNWIDKIARRLKKEGHLQKIGRRLCAHGSGAEAVYHIVNRDKFKLEVMR